MMNKRNWRYTAMNGGLNRTKLFPASALAVGLGMCTVIQAATPGIQHNEAGRPTTGFYASERVEFAFDNDLQVRLERGALAGLDQVTANQLSAALDEYRADQPMRLFSSLSEADVDRLLLRGSRTDLPDLNNWYSCNVGDTKSGRELAEALAEAARNPLCRPRTLTEDVRGRSDTNDTQLHTDAAPSFECADGNGCYECWIDYGCRCRYGERVRDRRRLGVGSRRSGSELPGWRQFC